MSSKPDEKPEDEEDWLDDWFDDFFDYGPEPRRKGDEDDDDDDKDAPKRKKATDEDLADVLNVKGLDLKIQENTVDHRTDKYDCTEDRLDGGQNEPAELVIRRGQTFVVDVTFDRDFVPDKDDLVFHFETGKNATLRPSTHGTCAITEEGKKRFDSLKWDGHLVCSEDALATIEINPPANCAIGRWKLSIETKSIQKRGKTKKCRYRHPDQFYILFNPWCKDDQTYMDDTYLLKEYVLNDAGCVYKGNKKKPYPKPWNFGQFEDVILDAALLLMKYALNKNTKTSHNLSNPVWVARNVSRMVNHSRSGDKGVLVGNWSGKYSGGTSPLEWSGSVKILKEYYRTKKAVRFGQCWVFSGVTTTVLRALGIPARSVTNYMSAHDCDKTCTIDKFYRKDKGAEMSEYDDMNHDSVWNYHVWNECWSRRPDLLDNRGGVFDGWQALDATPQEKSEGTYQCGPCPVYAVKHGMVSIQYDSDFVFAEVNADIVQWEMTSDGPRRFGLKMSKVGQSISTKKPDGKKCDTGFLGRRKGRQDITHTYKYKDGSEQNRKAVMRAALGADKSSGAYKTEEGDIKFKLRHAADLLHGANLDVTLEATNKTSTSRTISAVVFMFLKQKYTGQVVRPPFKIDRKDKDEEIKAKGSVKFEVTLTYEDYMDGIDEDGSICVQAFAYVKPYMGRPCQNCVKSHSILVEEGPLDVKVPSTVKKGEKFEALIKVENPLNHELTDCCLEHEGRGVEDGPKVNVSNIRPKSSGDYKVELMPKRRGEFVVTFSFMSKQLQQMTCAATIVVK